MRWGTWKVVLAALAIGGAAGEAIAQSSGGRLDVPNFCAAVSSPLTELHPIHPSNRYQYQTMVMRASGVASADEVRLVGAKIRSFINANMASLRCSQPDFSPNNGNVLKLAVARQSNRFIDDVLRHWSVNLNYLDPVDGLTVLDYIEVRRGEYSETSQMARTLTRYYQQFRAAGALHARELK